MKKFIEFWQKTLALFAIVSFITFFNIRIMEQYLRSLIAVISINCNSDFIIMNPEVGGVNFEIESWVTIILAIIFLISSLILSYWGNVKMDSNH